MSWYNPKPSPLRSTITGLSIQMDVPYGDGGPHLFRQLGRRRSGLVLISRRALHRPDTSLKQLCMYYVVCRCHSQLPPRSSSRRMI